MEAADDICYTIIDFEDGINLGLIDEDYALEYLIKLVKNSIDIKKYHSLKSTKDRISYLRALAIGVLINEAVSIFLENEEKIMRGEFDKSLLDRCQFEAQINDIIKISINKIYKCKDVIEKEIAGYRIIGDLLDIFIKAYNNSYNYNESNYDKLILHLLPNEFTNTNENLYERIMKICNYIAGMSDGYATHMHKKLTSSFIKN